MSSGRRLFVCLLAATLLALTTWTLLVAEAASASKKDLRPNRVVPVYTVAKKPEHRRIENEWKKSRVLENVAQLFSPIRLPRRLTLRATPCEGDANSYYEDDEIKVCYEYIELVEQRTEGEIPPGTTRKNLIIGAMADAFFHEMGHALFDMLNVPVFGREEDAADQLSAFLMLRLAERDAPQLIAGAAHWFVMDDKVGPPRLEDYADEHSLPAQRYFNYLCLAYGSDPKLFAKVLEIGKLTKQRAQRCAGEYRQVERAFRRLILPYIDQRLLAKVRATRWFQFDTVK